MLSLFDSALAQHYLEILGRIALDIKWRCFNPVLIQVELCNELLLLKHLQLMQLGAFAVLHAIYAILKPHTILCRSNDREVSPHCVVKETKCEARTTPMH